MSSCVDSDYSLSVDWPALLWHRVRQLGAQPVQGPIREATEADIAARRAIIAAAKASRTKDLSPRDAQAQATPSSTSSASPTSAPPTSTPSSADAPSAEASTSSCYANAERAGDGRSTRPAHHCRDHPIWACPSQAKLQFQLQTIRTRQTCASTPVLWGPFSKQATGSSCRPQQGMVSACPYLPPVPARQRPRGEQLRLLQHLSAVPPPVPPPLLECFTLFAGAQTPRRRPDSPRLRLPRQLQPQSREDGVQASALPRPMPNPTTVLPAVAVAGPATGAIPDHS